jgi:hypothetical protein
MTDEGITVYIKWSDKGGFEKLLRSDVPWEDRELQCAGVYLHIETQRLPGGEEREYIGYVGRAFRTPFRLRQLQHYHTFLAGQRVIPKEFLTVIKDDWYPGLKKKGNRLETAAESDYYKAIFDKKSYLKLAEEFWDRANAQKIYLGKLFSDENHKEPIDLDVKDKEEYNDQAKKLKDIEIFLITELKPICNDHRDKIKDKPIYQVIHGGALDKEKITKLKNDTEDFMRKRGNTEIGD